MGQRSEIYVAVEHKDGTKQLTARYFGWNYGERMISRVAFTSKWLQARQYGFNKDDLISIIETNFDMVDHIHSEQIEPSSGKFKIFSWLTGDNGLNDGRAFIFINKDGKVKYCFTDNHTLKPLDCNEYMLFDTESCFSEYQWKNRDYKYSTKMKRCRNNIKWLKQNAEVMTQEEFNEFIHSRYEA